MVHIVGRGAAEVFARFEDVDPRSVLGGGDVKYHMGATGNFSAADGRKVGIHLVSNPSHLEAVDPVAMGRARAKQTRAGESGRNEIVPVIMHGDAAFAGQGITAETSEYGWRGRIHGRRIGEYYREQPDRLHYDSARLAFFAIFFRPGEAIADSRFSM